MRDFKTASERLARETLMPVAHAAKFIPACGRHGHASASALVRWILTGKGGVFLDGVRIGRGWLTSREALLRFAADVSVNAAGPDAPPVRQMERDAQAAMDRIRAARPRGKRLRELGAKC